MSATGVKWKRDITSARHIPSMTYSSIKCHLSDWAFNETFRVNTSELSFLPRTRRQMVLLEATQADGKTGSPGWKSRSPLLPGWQWQSSLKSGVAYRQLGFFPRDSPQFYVMARLVGPDKMSQQLFVVTQEPQKTSVTVL